jgi:hypothetical protein
MAALANPTDSKYVTTPLRLSAENAPKPVPMLIKYQQPEDQMAHIYNWMKRDEDGFLTNFAIPHYCAWSARGLSSEGTRAKAAAQGLPWPVRPEQFLPLTPGKRTLLKELPYRLSIVETIQQVEPPGFVIVPVINENPAEQIVDVVYCELRPTANKSGPAGFPRRVNNGELMRMLYSSLRTLAMLPTRKTEGEVVPNLLILDLYLSRPTGGGPGGHYFHCDSGFTYGIREGAQAHGHEHLDYVSLVMLIEQGRLGRTTSLIANRQIDRDTGPRRMATFLAKSSTCVVFKDSVFFHTTPSPRIVRGELGAGEDIEEQQLAVITPEGERRDSVRRRVTPLNVALGEAGIAHLEERVERSFIRSHFIKKAKARYRYTPVGPAMVVLLSDFLQEGTPTMPVFPKETTFTIRVDQLNQALSSSGIFGPKEGFSKGFILGGKSKMKKNKSRKNKKNKSRKNKKMYGGINIDDNVMILVNENELDKFDKCKTGLMLDL